MTVYVGDSQKIDFADPKTVILANLLCQQRGSVPSKIPMGGCGEGLAGC